MSQQVAMNFVDVNGARLKYESRGEGHPLVLVHGGLADMRMWDEHMEPLARRFRVIRFDLRGFGESVMPPGSFSFHEDSAGLLHALDISSAYMLGLSFGGKIALDFTLEHPEMVDALILVGASLGGDSFGPETRSKIEVVDSRLDAGDVDGAVELELQLWIDGPNRTPEEVDPEVRERVREMNRHNYEVESDEGTPIWPETPAAERLHEIAVPTLIVVGAIDLPDILQVGRVLESAIPHARLVSIPHAAHHAPNERPEDFTRLVLDFLEGLPA
jgi:3-oxoadipate enol-lactonase